MRYSSSSTKDLIHAPPISSATTTIASMDQAKR
jgi:hypothetical protein